VTRAATHDHAIALQWCRAQLEQALAALDLDALVPGGTGGRTGLEAFVIYLDRVRPVVLLESRQPYAEHLVAELVQEAGPFGEPDAIPSLLSGHGGLAARFDRQRTLVLSFHEEPAPEEPLVLLHDLDTTDNPVLMGCRRRGDVPADYLQRVDLFLSLPAAGAGILEQVFRHLFGAPLPGGEGDAGRWRDFAEPTDLQQPARQGYEAQAAADYVRERVQRRLRNLSAEDAPALDDLHGLGEARAVARDLVRDIALARAGAIPWSEVDRGMLLVGPPGTGKTTLARALARECGVKFVVASAAEWQAVENLGQHLANIRDAFDEARRYQPAILFIDEMDSIGSRERFSGHEIAYQTPVVNMLLEQLDGFGEREQVVVIAATNHEEAVDPALRRAGRLDQVVRVPYPTVAALARIYRFHLAPHETAGRLAGDVDVEELAGLSFGLTGADVEFFVRGAARRARRDGGRIRQAHLVAEVLRKPRGDGPRRPLEGEALRRLAVHEAGHALARVLGPSRGEDIAYVAITPRSDGRVGYLAATADDHPSATRDDYLHRLGVMLAGRAAEEVIYGGQGVSHLAGRHGHDSDLARATALAGHLLGSTGLGGTSLLWWPALPRPAGARRRDQVARLLEGEYGRVVASLRAHRPALEAIAAALVERQELSGAEVIRLASAARPRAEGAGPPSTDRSTEP